MTRRELEARLGRKLLRELPAHESALLAQLVEELDARVLPPAKVKREREHRYRRAGDSQ